MLKKDALELFGGVSRLAEALDIYPAAVSQWGDVIPKLREFQIKEILEKQRHIEPGNTPA